MHWTVHLEGGPRRVNHAAVTVGDNIFSFGGYCTGDDYRHRRPIDVHVLHTVNYRWESLPLARNYLLKANMPYQRYGHTAVPYGDKIYLWGGRNDEAACNVLFCFDTDTRTWSRPQVYGKVPGARDGHSACIIDHCMYVFGGFEEDVDRFSQDVHCLDLRTFVWSYIMTLGDPPTFRDFHTATTMDSCMYVFGGRGDEMGPYHSQSDVYCNNIMYLDTRTHRWHKPITTGEVPEGRRSHSAFVYKNELYIFGGYNGLLDEHYDDLHKFCAGNICRVTLDMQLREMRIVADTNSWTKMKVLGRGPCKRRRQSCCVVGDRVFLFGGTSPYTGDEPDYHRTDLEGIDTKLMDHNDLFVLDFSPSLMTLCLLTVINKRIAIKDLPQDICWEVRMMTTHNSISRPSTNTG